MPIPKDDVQDGERLCVTSSAVMYDFWLKTVGIIGIEIT
jgi:hypothetical protein